MRGGTHQLYPYQALLRGVEADRAGVHAARMQSLRRSVRHAAENVPYYARLFAEAGVDARRVRRPCDLARLPVTTKDDLRQAAAEDLLAADAHRTRLVPTSTSGSSGVPFTVWRTVWEHRAQLAFGMRTFGGYGARLGDRTASVEFIQRDHAQKQSRAGWLAARLGINNRLRVHCCLPPAEILRRVTQHRPRVLGGYPTVLAAVADLIGEGGWPGPPLRFVVSGAEMLSGAVRRKLVRAFGAPAHNIYGSVEFGLLAWECPQSGQMHVCDDNVVLEVLSNGRPAQPGETGQVVATALHNYTMPFIRFALGDLAVQGERRCPCGAPFSTIRGIQGRTLDMFELPGGRALHPYALAGHALDTCPWVRRWQLVQERRDRIVLQVAAAGPPPAEDIRRIQNEANEHLSADVTFELQLLESIPLGPGGKLHHARSLTSLQQSGKAAHGSG